MGFHNPAMPWSELVETLAGRPPAGSRADSDRVERPRTSRRRPYVAPSIVRPEDAVPYAELHAHSSFSFLDGASGPAELVEEAERLGLAALALTDHDGYYGVARFAEAAEATGVATVFGAELSLGWSLGERSATEDVLRTGVADPTGEHLLLLARGPDGYHGISRTITAAQLRGGEKGRPAYDLDELAALRGDVVALTGCRKGAVRRALETGGVDAAAGTLDRLVELFGRDGVLVELTDHGDPTDSRRNDLLAELAAVRALPVVATNAVHYARPEQARLAEAIAAVRANRLAARARRRAPALRRRDAGAVPPLPWRGRADRRGRARARLPAPQAQAGAAALGRPGRPHADGPPPEAGPGRRAREVPEARRQWPGADRAGARGHRAEGLPRLLPHRARHRAGGEAARHPLPGARQRGGERGLLSARDHRDRRDRLRPPLRAVHLDLPRGGAGHRRRLRLGAPRGDHQVRLRQVRPGARRAGLQRDPVPAEERDPGHGPGARLLAGPAGRLREGGRARRGDAPRRRPRAGARVHRRAAQGPAASRHPLRRHGAHRSAGRRGRADRARADAGPHRHPVGQGRRRGHGAREVRPARPGHARGAAAHLRVRRRVDRRAMGPRIDPEGGGRRLRHALPRRRDRRLPGRVPRAAEPAPPAPAPRVLRPRDPDRADPTRSDPGRGGASLCRAPTAPRADRLPAPEAEEGARTHPRHPDLPGAAHPDGGGHRRELVRGHGPAPARDGLQAGRRAHRVRPGTALRGHGAQRHRR